MTDITKPSRQVIWQRARRAEGRCTKCNEPSQGRNVCDACAALRGVTKRHPLKSVWAAVNWSQVDERIALRLGVRAATVDKQRKKRAMPKVKL